MEAESLCSVFTTVKTVGFFSFIMYNEKVAGSGAAGISDTAV